MWYCSLNLHQQETKTDQNEYLLGKVKIRQFSLKPIRCKFYFKIVLYHLVSSLEWPRTVCGNCVQDSSPMCIKEIQISRRHFKIKTIEKYFFKLLKENVELKY